MSDMFINGITAPQTSVFEETFDNIGKGFEDILADIEKINADGGQMSASDAMSLQMNTFQYTLYQEVVTKIASKSATAINDVMKAQ